MHQLIFEMGDVVNVPGEFQEADGTPYDFTGLSPIVDIEPSGPASVLVVGSVPASGEITLRFTAGMAAKKYRGRIRVTDGVQHFTIGRFEFEVLE